MSNQPPRPTTPSQQHRIPVTGELRFAPINSLQEASTAQLLDELARRSVGCLVVALRAEEPTNAKGREKAHADRWYYRVKGSTVLLAAMDAALAIELHRMLHAREEDGLAPTKKR